MFLIDLSERVQTGRDVFGEAAWNDLVPHKNLQIFNEEFCQPRSRQVRCHKVAHVNYSRAHLWPNLKAKEIGYN